MEPGEATEVDGDMVMAEDDTDARDTHHVANDVVEDLDLAPSASQIVPPPLPCPLPSRNYALARGGDVSARAHTCGAWGRWVAFGRPNMSTNRLWRGGDVSARAHTCVAWGRWVAFGRPNMSVWGHAGAGSAPAKVACNSKFARPNLELI